MIALYSVLFYVNLYYVFLYLQESHYHFSSFFMMIRKGLKSASSYLLLVPLISLFYTNDRKYIFYNLMILVIIVFYIVLVVSKKYVLKLKITKRIVRLFAVVTLLYSLILYLYMIKYTNSVISVYLIMPLSMVGFIINMPIERLYKSHYINKAHKKIAKIKPLVIGITGSAGKTTCKHFLYEMLKHKYITFMTPKSYNTDNGIAMSINNGLDELTEIAIIEYGASHKNDIKSSLKVVKPDISLITNIFCQHLETFNSIDTIIKEKVQIMKSSAVHFYNTDKKYELDRSKNNISFSQTYGDYYLDNIEYKRDYTKFILVNKGKRYSFETNIIGQKNILNLCACIGICMYLGLKYNYLYERVRNLSVVSARLEVIKKDGFTLINDGFNSNKEGFIQALDVLKRYEHKRILITPGVVSGGTETKSINEELALLIIESSDLCYIVESSVSSYLCDVFDRKLYDYHKCKSFEKAYEEAIKESPNVILIENDITDIYGG